MLGCPSCGRENPEDARFCNACGAPLALAPEAPREVREDAVRVLLGVLGEPPDIEMDDGQRLERHAPGRPALPQEAFKREGRPSPDATMTMIFR